MEESLMRRLDLNEWYPAKFTEEQIVSASDCLLKFYDTNLMYLLNSLYVVTEVKEVIKSEELDQRVKKDWIDYLTTDGKKADDKLYKIAKELAQIEGMVENPDDLSERGGYWKNILDRLLNVGLTAKERDLVTLINKYIKSVGKAGIVGELKQFLQVDDIATKKIDELCEGLRLYRVFKCIEVSGADLTKKTTAINKKEVFSGNIKDEERLVKYLLTRMGELDQFSRDLLAILERDASDENDGCGGVNLGLEEQQLVFMLPETLKFFETTEGELSYAEIDEMAEFLFYYYDILSSEALGENKTNRGIKKRLAKLNAKEDVDRLIRCMLEKSAEEENFTTKMEEIDAGIKSGITASSGFETRFSGNIYEQILKKWMLYGEEVNGALHSFLKIRITSAMGKKNVFDFLQTMLYIKSDEDFDMIKHCVEEVKRIAEFSYSLVMIPEEDWKEDDLYERFAKATARSIEKQRYKNCEQLWMGLMKNYYDIQPWGAICRRPVIDENVEDVKVSTIKDKKLSELLRGKKDSRMKQKRENVNRIMEWFNQVGIVQLDYESFFDFKAVYDVIYTFDIKALQKETNIDIRINDFKNENISPSMYSEEQKLFLVLGVVMAVMYNRQNLSDGILFEVCQCICDVIRQHYDYFDIVNHDLILILLNAFRDNWAIIFDEENI